MFMQLCVWLCCVCFCVLCAARSFTCCLMVFVCVACVSWSLHAFVEFVPFVLLCCMQVMFVSPYVLYFLCMFVLCHAFAAVPVLRAVCFYSCSPLLCHFVEVMFVASLGSVVYASVLFVIFVASVCYVFPVVVVVVTLCCLEALLLFMCSSSLLAVCLVCPFISAMLFMLFPIVQDVSSMICYCGVVVSSRSPPLHLL